MTRVSLQLSPAHHLAREGEPRATFEVKPFCDLRGPSVQLHKCGPMSGPYCALMSGCEEAQLYDSSL